MNRKVFIESVDGTYKHDFGANYALIDAVMKLPKFEGVSTITYSVTLSGKELKEFLIKNEVEKEIILEIKDDLKYILEAWDY